MFNLIKSLHTFIWLVMAMSVFYIGYCVVVMNFDSLFYVAVILISLEIIIIVANSWQCPLTGIARRHTDDTAPNFDIFLPKIIAQYNKEIFSVILAIILGLYLTKILS